MFRNVEGRYTLGIFRPRNRFGMAQRMHRVVVTGPPVLLHATARELVVLGVAFILLGPVDQVYQAVDFLVAE